MFIYIYFVKHSLKVEAFKLLNSNVNRSLDFFIFDFWLDFGKAFAEINCVVLSASYVS